LWQVGCFLPGTPTFSTNKTDRHDIAEILLNVAFNPNPYFTEMYQYQLRILHVIRNMSFYCSVYYTNWSRRLSGFNIPDLIHIVFFRFLRFIIFKCAFRLTILSLVDNTLFCLFFSNYILSTHSNVI
jgi:hypothetical protein